MQWLMRLLAVASPACAVRLEAGVRVLPHPAKAKTGGEDAYFISGRAFGVFDGVGGWASQGVDAGIFSRSLATHAKAAYEARRGASLSTLLQAALSEVTAVGSCTACLVRISEDGVCEALNLGDSGFRIFRGAADADPAAAPELVLGSRAQQHRFNMPVQLGSGSRDGVGDGETYCAALRKGDVVVMATDGVFDNLFDDEIAKVLAEHVDSCDATELAGRIAERARETSLSSTCRTPFAVAAEAQKLEMPGGKLDDVTVLCVKVLGPAEGEATPPPRSKL